MEGTYDISFDEKKFNNQKGGFKYSIIFKGKCWVFEVAHRSCKYQNFKES